MKKNLTVLLLAAGSGERLGNISKAFLLYKQQTLLEYALNLFKKYCEFILVGIGKKDFDLVGHLKNKKIIFVQGGETRHQTIKNLLANVTTEEIILHDIARPFFSEELLQRLLVAGEKFPVVCPALTLQKRDCVVILDRQTIITPPSDQILELQTPQFYKTEILRKSYLATFPNYFSSSIQVVANAGYSIHFIAGDPQNLKITYPEDLQKLALM